jgi:hypothetical protein
MKKTSPKYLLVLLLIGIHLWQASLVRPVADDYTLLGIYSREGFTASISYIWNNFGGNITPAVIRAVFVTPSLDASNWYGFIAFAIVTSILVITSYLILMSWLTDRRIDELTLNDVLIVLLASLAFEGLFTPGLSSAYLFGAAAGVHLWPICLFIIFLKIVAMTSERIPHYLFVGFLVIVIFFGFIVGNSGLAESSAILVSLLLLNIWIRFKPGIQSRPRLQIALNAYLLGATIGLAIIFLAPGFSDRNDRLGKIDEGYVGLLVSFRSSLASFSGEIITHPIWIFVTLAILLGNKPYKVNLAKSRWLLVFITSVFSMLILGGTFGYAAWHQSSGLIFLLTPAAICLPLLQKQNEWLTRFIQSPIKYIYLPIISIVLIGLLFRGLVVQEIRSSAWDSNFTINLCSSIESSQLSLLGAEIKYWPIGLGIEDVNRWDWMAMDYRNWLTSIRANRFISCN